MAGKYNPPPEGFLRCVCCWSEQAGSGRRSPGRRRAGTCSRRWWSPTTIPSGPSAPSPERGRGSRPWAWTPGTRRRYRNSWRPRGAMCSSTRWTPGSSCRSSGPRWPPGSTTWTWPCHSPAPTRTTRSPRRASSSVTSSSPLQVNGRARGSWPWWGWAWSPASPTSSRGTPPITSSPPSTRWVSATEPTWSSRDTSSPPPSRSGRRSRNASTRRSSTSAGAAGTRRRPSASPRSSTFPRASARSSA